MAKDKKHNKPKRMNLAMHSKKTGAIILGVLAFLVIGGSAFMVLAHNENVKFEIELDNFQALSCVEIDNMNDLKRWQREAYLNMIRAGECSSGEPLELIPVNCFELFDKLEKARDEDKQKAHDELKKAGC
jgi:hypothetical protein